MHKPRVALVHDYIKEYGGAERVLETLHEIFPGAPVYTSVYLPEFLGPHKERFKSWDIRTSWLQYLPMKHKMISPFRLLTPWVFKQFDFKGYDVIIVSATGAYTPNVLKKKKAVHICYCHTPPRYLYGYATARDWKKHKVVAVVASLANHWLRMVDYKASQNVDLYIANSQEIAGRIEKFYRRDSTVIYPPVEVSITNHESRITSHGNKEYFITGGRLARAKHVNVIIKACNEMKVPLKIFGKGFAGYGEELQKLAGPTVEMIGEVTDEEKAALLSGAKAFLFASEDEDFGIIPVEAMGYGLPVIAYRSGGVQETVIENKTGLFFDELSAESLKTAIKGFEKKSFKREDCIMQADRFSKEHFMKEIQDFVEKHI